MASQFLFGVLAVAGDVLPSSANDSGRAADTEPNNDRSQAVPIADGEVVEGSVLIPSSDYVDYYRIDVPYGKALNASLYLRDYDPANKSKYDLNLYLYSNSYYWLDNSSTNNRWESVSTLQYWNSAGPATVYVVIWYGYYSQGTRYAVSASISDIPEYNTTAAAAAVGYLEGGTGPVSRAWYRLDPAPLAWQEMQAQVIPPANAVFSVHVYNLWDVNGAWYLRNESWLNSPGYYQTVRFNGCGGTYYVMLKGISGNGTYGLTVGNVGKSMDENNLPSAAMPVRDLSPHTEFVDQGVDWVDWWVVTAKAGKPIVEVFCSLVLGTYDNWSSYNLSAYDKDQKYLAGDNFPYYGVTYGDIWNLTVNYDGPVYFAIKAVSNYVYGANNFVPARTWYKITFTLPNDPPRLNGSLPEVRLREDASDDRLVLSDFVSDPDNDTLNFTLFGSGYHSRPKVDRSTGRVNFTPEVNWNGQEVVRFQAIDDGPGNRVLAVNTTVKVEPVDDPPQLVGSIDDITSPEDRNVSTPDLTKVFSDVDDTAPNLTFTMRVVSQDTHPPAAILKINMSVLSRDHVFWLEPPRWSFGNFTLEVNCTDRGPENAPASARFNLSVTHQNHAPGLAKGTPDPLVLTVQEHGSNSELAVTDLFTDPDVPADYANDALNFTVTGMNKLSAGVLSDGRLLVDTGNAEFYPGAYYEEKLVLTARDRAGLRATLNLTVQVIPVDDPPYYSSAQPSILDTPATEGKKEMFRVTAADNDTSELTYSWYVDGTKETVQAGTIFYFQPDFNMGGAVHTVKVVISDGTTNVSLEWRVNVLDSNRLPEVTVKSPANQTRFKEGTPVSFLAEASADPDGDPLNFTWRDESGAVMGTGPSFSTSSLKSGTHTIKLEVSDGKGSVFQYMTVIIYSDTPAAAKGFIPGPTTAVALAAAGIALALATFVWRRKDC